MRTHLIGFTAVLFCCTALAKDKEVSISAKGEVVLKLTAPEDAKVKVGEKGEKTTIEAKNLWLYVWPVPGAKTVADGVAHAGEVIKGEFTGFTVGGTENIKVAGKEAKHLKGKGTEADDGDPGNAEVVIFAVGKHVFAACVHGEGDHATKEHDGMMAVLQTAKAP